MKGMGLDSLRLLTVMENIDLRILGSLLLLGESRKLSVPVNNLDFLIICNKYYYLGCTPPYWGENIL